MEAVKSCAILDRLAAEFMSTVEASPHRAGPASPFLAPPILQKILGSTPLLLLATAAAYFIAAKIGIAASIGPHGIAIVWPGNAIVLFILLSIPREKWWLVYLTVVATEIVADVPDYPLWAAVGYGLVNASEATLAAWLLRRYKPEGPPLLTVRDFAAFIAIGPIFAAGLAAFGGAAMYKFNHAEIDYFHYWRIFWFGDALGLLALAPALLVWSGQGAARRRLTFAGRIEALVLAAGLFASAGVVFSTTPTTPLAYLVFPFLLWAALRFGLRGASASTIVIVAIAVLAANYDFGPFVAVANIEGIVALQSLLGVVILSTYLLAFSVEEWWRAESRLVEAHAALAAQNRELDHIVARKTEQLTLTVARNELLLKEIHHRVKNNLQLISSILSLKARRDPELRETFDAIQRQISAIASTYSVIQTMDHFDSVDFCKVAAALCSDLKEAFGDQIRLEHDVQGEAKLDPNIAISLSLALNELVTNSAKHCVKDDGAASVRVSCRQDLGQLVLRVADDGPGFPADFDPHTSTSFGMQMIRHVVAQADGRLHASAQPGGATVSIHLPLAAPADGPISPHE